jgi:integrase
VGDVDLNRGRLRFVHRPDRDTPLKNGVDGERIVGIPEQTASHIRGWLRNRPKVQDDYGRDPLFTTQNGRAARTTLRESCYYATIPCHVVDCPHDQKKRTCDWSSLRYASPCPSSRSPHQVRTGSIVWQINQGIPKDVVAERANVSVDVLEQHYDHPTAEEAFLERRKRFVSHLDFDYDSKK